MKGASILLFLIAYLFAIMTLAQFCESKAVQKTSIKYKVYRILLSPISLPFKLLKIDIVKSIQDFMDRMNNGRSYAITCFYYALYFVSLYFTYRSSVSQNTIIFPHVDAKDSTKMQWKPYNTKAIGMDFMPPILILIMFICHFASFISFTVSVRRHPNSKTNNYVADGIMYAAKKCEDCKAPRPPRTGHCENCKECIQKRDHHCIWINRCVGRRNLLWFNIFLNSTAYACLLVGLMNIITVGKMMSQFPSKEVNMMMLYKKKVFGMGFIFQWLLSSIPVHTASGFIHLVISAMLIPFGAVHIIQILTNQTSYEKQKIQYVKEGLRYEEYDMCRIKDPMKKKYLKEKGRPHIILREHTENMDDVIFEEERYEILTLKAAIKEISKYNFYSVGMIKNLVQVVKDGFE